MRYGRRMRITAIAIAAVLACGASCGGGKTDAGAGSAAGSAVVPAPAACAAGSLPGPGGACVVVITAPKIAALQAQQTRIEELGSLLDKVDLLAAPIELLDGIRQLDAWKTIAARSDKLKVVDAIVQTLADSVKQLRAFRGDLGEVSKRLTDLRQELDKLIAGTGYAKSLADARVQISSQVRGLVQPYAKQTSETIQTALAPLVTQLSEVADLLRGACAMAKLSGGGNKLKDLCGKANDAFTQAQGYLDGLKARPALLFDGLTAQLLGSLDQLIDDGTRVALTEAQTRVDHALLTPVPTAGSGSGAGAGSSSGAN